MSRNSKPAPLSKRQKIQAKLDHPSTPEHEKEVCRNILAKMGVGAEIPVDTPIFEPDDRSPEEIWKIFRDTYFPNSIEVFSIRSTPLCGCICQGCGNLFKDKNYKALWCPICLKSKSKENNGEAD